MIELIFGFIWTLFSCIFMFAMFFATADHYVVNGQEVSKSEFDSMLAPKLFIGLFIAVGLFLMIKGAIKVFKNMQTKVKGEECFGRVLAVERNGTYVNERPVYKAQIILYSNLDMTDYTIWEDIGFNPTRFPVGSFVRVLYYKGDINFDEESGYTENIPEGTKQYLLSKTNFLKDVNNEDYIIVDGIKYVKENKI